MRYSLDLPIGFITKGRMHRICRRLGVVYKNVDNWFREDDLKELGLAKRYYNQLVVLDLEDETIIHPDKVYELLGDMFRRRIRAEVKRMEKERRVRM